MDHLHGEPLQYRLHRASLRLSITADEAACAVADVHGRTLIIGMGLGELAVAALARGASVTGWDRDPAVMRAALERVDLSKAIADRRVRLKLGVDLVSLSTSAFHSVVLHPLLGQVYARDVRLLQQGVTGRRALVCQGGLFVDDVADALEAEGYSVYTWDILRLSAPRLDQVVKRFDPEVIFAINHTHGLAEACHRLGRPLVVWEIDPATDGLRRCASPTDGIRIATYRKRNVPRFEAAGFRHVRYTPLAANTARRCPGVVAADVPAAGQVCFVGASMVDQAKRFRALFTQTWVALGGAEAAGLERLDAVLAAQRRLGGRYSIPELVTAGLRDFAERSKASLSHDLVAMVAEMAAAERRLSVVAGLGPCDVHVWGDPGWRAVEAHGARYMGYAGHNAGLTEIYRAGAIHVDVARLYQQDIVPMRIFDILACGGFVIAEHSDALASLFVVGEELESWRTPDELRAKVRHFKAHPEQARQIALAGLARVQADHSIQARVRQMLDSLGGLHRSAG